MEQLPKCPKCQSEYTYIDQNLYVCPECAFEWNEEYTGEDTLVVKDANGVLLQDGDTVMLVKTLKVKGGSGDLKQGTKVKNIKCVEGDHNISCRIDGFGGMDLKSEFVKKV